jgi:hypothetical protein
VIYEPNGGTGNVNVVSVPQNSNYTIVNQGYTRVRYEFIGWNTRSDGLGTYYLNGQVIFVTNNIILYAQWRPIN